MSPQPLYKEVKSQIVRSLVAGEWKAGEPLPSEAKLGARYGVGIATIRAAVGELVAANVLARKQGKGTFVLLHTQQRSIHQFFHVVKDHGVREFPRSELLSLQRAKADAKTSRLLQLTVKGRAAEVFKLRNVLRIGETPVVLSDIVIPATLFPGLNETVISEGGETLYAVYQARYGINIIRIVEELRAIKADAAAARWFALNAGDPVLEIQRLAFTFNGVPVETRRSRVLTKNYHYLMAQGSAD